MAVVEDVKFVSANRYFDLPATALRREALRRLQPAPRVLGLPVPHTPIPGRRPMTLSALARQAIPDPRVAPELIGLLRLTAMPARSMSGASSLGRIALRCPCDGQLARRQAAGRCRVRVCGRSARAGRRNLGQARHVSRVLRLVKGTSGNDLLRGSRSGDILEGLGGNDRLYGRAGADRLYGGAGNDRLSRGSTATTSSPAVPEPIASAVGAGATSSTPLLQGV